MTYRVNDDPNVIELHVMDHVKPVARYWFGPPGSPVGGPVGQWIGPPPPCGCGHPDALHDPTPGVGCMHRPYCLCVHPTGQRVPRTEVRIKAAGQ